MIDLSRCSSKVRDREGAIVNTRGRVCSPDDVARLVSFAAEKEKAIAANAKKLLACRWGFYPHDRDDDKDFEREERIRDREGAIAVTRGARAPPWRLRLTRLRLASAWQTQPLLQR